MAETGKGKSSRRRTVVIVAGVLLALAVVVLAAALVWRYLGAQPGTGATVPVLVDAPAGGGARTDVVGPPGSETGSDGALASGCGDSSLRSLRKAMVQTTPAIAPTTNAITARLREFSAISPA